MWLLIPALLFLSGVSLATPKQEPFVLYILSENFNTLDLGYEAERSWAILKSVDLSKGTFRIPASDIESYDPERQTFVLTKGGRLRFVRSCSENFCREEIFYGIQGVMWTEKQKMKKTRKGWIEIVKFTLGRMSG